LINYKTKENEKIFLLAMITVMGVATSCARNHKKVKPQLLKWLK
jgi:hypothetical protein